MIENRVKLPVFDDYWIDFRRGTTRRWFAPEAYSLAPLGHYGSMFFDPGAGKYRLYLEDVLKVDGDPRHARRYLKLAESDDLREFSLYASPHGGDVLYDGETGLHGCTVLYDDHDADPARRYKLCGMLDMGRYTEMGDGANWMGVEIAFSGDGIHWERHPELRASPQTSDALNKLMYNPLLGEYALFHRSAYVDRRISMRTSRDLEHWSAPRLILHPGASYNDEHTAYQHYSLSARYMDGIFYGLLWRYNTSLCNDDYSRMYGYMEPELVYSYDGREFLYTTGKPLMERPYPPLPGCAGLSPLDICESRDGRDCFILCSGQLFVHGARDTDRTLAEMNRRQTVTPGNPVYRIRKDGFCGIESVSPGGMVITKGVALLRDDLSFNLRCGCGWARFGIMDIQGHYIEGFEPDNCVPFAYDDSVDVRPVWKDHSLNELLGRQVRIAVELNTAILHCVSMTAQPYIRQKQRSFADPEGVVDARMDSGYCPFPGQMNR